MEINYSTVVNNCYCNYSTKNFKLMLFITIFIITKLFIYQFRVTESLFLMIKMR